MSDNFPLLRAERQNWGRDVGCLLAKRVGNEMHVGRIEWTAVPDGEWVARSFNLSQQDAQALMDQLWDCGLRPTEGAGSAGSLSATQRHLEDFRKLVFEDERFKPRTPHP